MNNDFEAYARAYRALHEIYRGYVHNFLQAEAEYSNAAEGASPSAYLDMLQNEMEEAEEVMIVAENNFTQHQVRGVETFIRLGVPGTHFIFVREFAAVRDLVYPPARRERDDDEEEEE